MRYRSQVRGRVHSTLEGRPPSRLPPFLLGLFPAWGPGCSGGRFPCIRVPSTDSLRVGTVSRRISDPQHLAPVLFTEGKDKRHEPHKTVPGAEVLILKERPGWALTHRDGPSASPGPPQLHRVLPDSTGPIGPLDSHIPPPSIDSPKRSTAGVQVAQSFKYQRFRAHLPRTVPPLQCPSSRKGCGRLNGVKSGGWRWKVPWESGDTE